MLLDTLTLPSAKLNGIAPYKVLVDHFFPRSDNNYVSELGLGITGLSVSGWCDWDEMINIMQKTQQDGTKRLYFNSIADGDDDVYYIVKTEAAQFVPVGAMLFKYSFACKAADPKPYSVATEAYLF